MSHRELEQYLSRLPADIVEWLKFQAAGDYSIKQVWKLYQEHGPRTKSVLMVMQCSECEQVYDSNHPDSFTQIRERLRKLKAEREAVFANIIRR